MREGQPGPSHDDTGVGRAASVGGEEHTWSEELGSERRGEVADAQQPPRGKRRGRLRGVRPWLIGGTAIVAGLALRRRKR